MRDTPHKRLASLAATLLAAATLFAAAPASAAIETVVPTAPIDRSFATSAGGWTSSLSYGGLGCVPPQACGAADWSATGGAGGSGDGWISVRQTGGLQPLASVTGTWTSPAFTAPSVTDEGTLSIKVRPQVAALLALAGAGADLDVDLVSTSPAQTIALWHDVPLTAEGTWTTHAVAIPAGQVVGGRAYRLRLSATFTAGASSVTASEIGIDDVSLTLRDLLPPTGLSASASTGTPVEISGSVDPHGLSTAVTVEFGASVGALTESAGPAAVAGAGAQPYAIALSGLTPGTTYFYRATAVNADGTATSSIASFTAPWPPSNAAPVVDGSPRHRARVAVFDDAGADSAVVEIATPGGQVLTFPDTDGDGRVALTLPDEDGQYTVTVIRTTNGTPTTSLPVTALLDRVGPALGSAQVSVAPVLDDDPSRQVTVTLPPDAVAATAQVVDADGADIGGPVDLSSGSAMVTLGVTDEAYTVRVTVWDAAGNATAVMSDELVLDTTAPAVGALGLTVTPSTSADRLRQVSLTVPADAASVRAQVLDAGGSPVGPDVDASSGATTVQLGSADGDYRVRITLTDAAGNTATADSGVLVLDSVAPSTAALALAVTPGSASVRTRSVALTVPADAVTARAQVLDTQGDPVGADVDASSGSADVQLGVTDGTYRVRIVLRDAAGNASTALSGPLVLDREAPVLTGADIDVTPLVASVRPRQLTVSLPGDATYARAQVVDANDDPVGGGVDASSGSAQVQLGVADGAYRVRVTVRDALGNERSALSDQLALDTVAPSTTGLGLRVQPAASPDRPRDLTLQVPFDAVAAQAQVVDATVTPIGAPVDGSSGAAVVQLGTVDGTYRVVVTLADAAGNTSTATSGDVVLDRQAPDPSALGIAVTPMRSDQRARHVVFTMPADAVASRLQPLDGGGNPLGSPVSATAGEGDVVLPDAPGAYGVRAIVRDAAGNESSADSGPVTLLPAATRSDGGPAPTPPGPVEDGGRPGAIADPGGFGGVLQACYGTDLALTDVRAAGTRVTLRGISRFAPGTPIAVLDGRGRTVGSTTSGADGWFDTSVPAPSGAGRARARYSVAVVGRRSQTLRLMRANAVNDMQVRGRTVTLSGAVDTRIIGGGRVRWEVRGGHGPEACGSRAPRLRITGRARMNRKTGAYTLSVVLPDGAGPLIMRTRVTGRSSSYSTYVVR
jgi:hypothetical protein